jgi:soluble lytic murein transglycosylase-like protein
MNKIEINYLKVFMFIIFLTNLFILSYMLVNISNINIPSPSVMAPTIQSREEIKPILATIQFNEPTFRTQPHRIITNNFNDNINNQVKNICAQYNQERNSTAKIEPEVIMSMIYAESRYNPKSQNGNCVGLMQVSTRWHSERAAKLGVTNLYDPYGNILVGIDYFAELLRDYKDVRLALMLYSMKHKDAFDMYARGEISSYTKAVLARAETYKERE